MENLFKARITKYIKRIPKPSGKGYIYFYTKADLDHYNKTGEAPKETKTVTEKGSFLSKVMSWFWFKDKKQALEKITADYKASGIDTSTFTLQDWLSHVEEYFKNKEKWDKFFGAKTGGGEKKPPKGGETKKPTGGGEKKPAKFKLSLMKMIHGLYSVRPEKPVETPKPPKEPKVKPPKEPKAKTPKEKEEEAKKESRDGYFNEKPAEIANVGADVWGARRHRFSTYETINTDISQMEKDGTAMAYVTKKNLFGDYGLENKADRVSKGETELKVMASYYVKELLPKMPPDDPDSRAKYMELCRTIQQLDHETKDHKEFINALAENFISAFPAVKVAEEGYYSNYFKRPDKINDIAGKVLQRFLYEIKGMSNFSDHVDNRLDKKEHDQFRIISMLNDFNESSEVNYKIVEKRIFGATKLLDFKIKKGDKIVYTPELGEKVRRLVKTELKFKDQKERTTYNEYKYYAERELRSLKESLEDGRVYSSEAPPEVGEIHTINRKYTNTKTGEIKYALERAKIISIDSDNYIKYENENGDIEFISLYEFVNSKRSEMSNGRDDRLENPLKTFNIRYGTDFKTKEEALSAVPAIKEKLESVMNKNVEKKTYLPISGEVVKTSKDYITVNFKFDPEYSSYGELYEISPEYLKAENVESVEKTAVTTGTFIPDLLVETKVERTGGTNYDGLTIPQMQDKLTSECKFKAIQYGNSMPETERQYHTKWTLESMTDLAEILDLPIEQVSSMGKLGIAFGARGQAGKGRGALAHYEPSTKMINLSRASGFGSLAHEWGHFMDNILSSGGGNFVSVTPETEKKLLSPTETPHGAIYEQRKGNRTKRYFFDSQAKNKNYPWAELKAGQSVPDSGSKYWSLQRGNNLWVNIPINSGIKGKIFNIAKISGESLQKQAREQNLLQLIDDKYYNNPCECFARAFESYVADKLENNGRKNTYLSSQKKTLSQDGKAVYPQGEFRKTLEPLFDELFKELKESGDLKKAIDKFFKRNTIVKIKNPETGQTEYRRK